MTATTIEELTARIAEGGVREARLQRIHADAEAFFERREPAERGVITRIDDALRILPWIDLEFDHERRSIGIVLDPDANMDGIAMRVDSVHINEHGRPVKVFMLLE